MKRLFIIVFVCLIATFALVGPGIAALVSVNFNGTITSIVEDGLSLPAGHNIAAGSSTFTGQFDYDTDDPLWYSIADLGAAYHATGALSIVIDGIYTFQASPQNIILYDRGPGTNYHPGVDRLQVFDNYNAVFPTDFTPNGHTSSINLDFGDIDGTAISSFALPSAVNLADWNSYRILKLETDDGDGGEGWTIRGEINAVPIPGAFVLFGSGLIGIVGMRRKFRR